MRAWRDADDDTWASDDDDDELGGEATVGGGGGGGGGALARLASAMAARDTKLEEFQADFKVRHVADGVAASVGVTSRAWVPRLITGQRAPKGAAPMPFSAARRAGAFAAAEAAAQLFGGIDVGQPCVHRV